MLPQTLLLATLALTAALKIAPTARLPTAAYGRTARSCARHAAVRLVDDEDPGEAAKEVVKEAEAKMKKSIASVQESLSTLRVGRASPTLLDRVQVNYYDTLTPLNQLASVTAPTASQLVVDVYAVTSRASSSAPAREHCVTPPRWFGNRPLSVAWGLASTDMTSRAWET